MHVVSTAERGEVNSETLFEFTQDGSVVSARGDRTPFQLAGVDLGDDDWVRMIEHEVNYSI